MISHFFRFVTSGGPSVNKLMPGDQILAIDGEDVKGAPRDHVINLVRNCRDTVTLLVCQPPLDNVSKGYHSSFVGGAPIWNNNTGLPDI